MFGGSWIWFTFSYYLLIGSDVFIIYYPKRKILWVRGFIRIHETILTTHPYSGSIWDPSTGPLSRLQQSEISRRHTLIGSKYYPSLYSFHELKWPLETQSDSRVSCWLAGSDIFPPFHFSDLTVKGFPNSMLKEGWKENIERGFKIPIAQTRALTFHFFSFSPDKNYFSKLEIPLRTVLFPPTRKTL